MSYAIFRSESINTIKDLGQIGAHNKRDKKHISLTLILILQKLK